MIKKKLLNSDKLNIIAKKIKKHKKNIYFIFFLVLVSVVTIGYSYSYFAKSDVIKNFSIIVGDLEYEVYCDSCSDGKVVLNANSSKVVNLNLVSNNPINTKCELYYKVITEGDFTNHIDSGYLGESEDVLKTSVGAHESKRVAIVLSNSSSEQLTLEIGLKPSLVSDNVVLQDDEISINKMITAENEGVIITSVEMVEDDTTDIDLDNTKLIYYYQNMLGNKIVLSKTNASSSVTYQVTIHNYTDIEQTFINLGTSYFEQNKNITYTITGISSGDKIASGESITFFVEFHYLNNKIPNEDNVNYIEDYHILDMSMKFNFGLSETEIVNTTTYSIYNKEQRLPVVINNNNDYDITGVISYNGTYLTEEISIPKNVTNYMIPVDISSIYDGLSEEVEYFLDFELTSPYSELYSNVVTFKKEQTIVNITNIETYINDVLVENDTVSYTENSIMVDNTLDSNNTSITYKITVKNNATNFGYKFRNITNVFNSNEELGYTTSVDLASGIMIDVGEEYTFDIHYQYDSTSSDNTHKQILQFEFKHEFLFEGTTESMISFSSRENSTSTNYGDFEVIASDFSSPTMNCSYEECYSDNNGELVYDEDGGLILDGNNTIAILNIDQSMGGRR